MVGQLRFISSYWGKAQPRNFGHCPPCHPLAYHNLDVAGVGSAIFETRPSILRRIAKLAGLPDDIARRWLLFALSIHDLGKFADCFQCLVPEHWAVENCQSWNTQGKQPWPLPHGASGHLLWHDVVGDRAADALYLDWDTRDTFASWFETVFGHHGRPTILSEDRIRVRAIATQRALEDAGDFALAAAKLFQLAGTGDIASDRGADGETASWLIAGLSVMADWIGSNQEWFPYVEPKLSLEEYWIEAQAKAKTAVAKAGLARVAIAGHYGLNDALNRTEASATPLQHWAATVPLDASGPIWHFSKT